MTLKSVQFTVMPAGVKKDKHHRSTLSDTEQPVGLIQIRFSRCLDVKNQEH